MNIKKEPFQDHYDVFEEIGKGHFAIVKRCVNKASGSEYAGKFIRKKRVCRGVPIEDIEREVETLSRLAHPGIIQFHDVYDTGQSVVLLLELVTGGELYEFISQRKNLTEAQSIHIIRQIIDAVSHMHSLNIAHLDLKPENVLLVEKVDLPTVKVIDFGLSHRLDSVAEVKAMFGTPEFVAPEIVNFESLTLATDMWAIGVITYILLSGGASPFLGETVQDTYTNVSSASYQFDDIYFVNISEAAKDFISKLLLRDPKKRNTVEDCQKHPWLQNKVTEILTPPVSLLSAIKDENMSVFEDILNSGNVDVNQTNKSGETGLHLAAAKGQKEMARLLLMCGANVAVADWQGDTPLIHASRHSNTEILLMFIKAGACVSIQNHEGDTALHIAAAWGELEIIKILIENGAMLHVPNHIGQLPLHIAILRRHTNVALFLLNSGSEFDVHDCDGNAPIHLAVREGLLSVVHALCSLGCNIDMPNNQGICPIHIAARLGHLDIVRCLCLMGCDTEIKNSDGIKAEITALKYGYNDISELLNKIKSNYIRDLYIRQLIPTRQPLPRFNVQIFGHSGVGKSTLLDSMRTGYISGFFKRTKTNHFNTKYAPLLGTLSQPNSPTRTHIELDSTLRQNSLNFDTYNHHSTHGIDVQQAWISGIGYVTLWDFSGQDTYFCFYHHMITTSASHAVMLLVFSLNDSPTVQYKQCSFWLSFLQARIPPTEPIGSCGRTGNMPKIILVATHADVVRAPKLTNGDFNSPQAQTLAKRLRARFSSHFDIYPTPIVVDAHVPNSYGLKLLKSAISEFKTSIWQGASNKNGNQPSAIFGRKGYNLLMDTTLQENGQLSPVCTQIRPRLYTKHPKTPKYGSRSMNGFCEAIVSWLPSLRKSAESIPVMTWEAFINEARNQVNPLAGNEHFSLLFSHLEQMGEVILIGDLIVLSPSWLCGQVLGQILSVNFITHARITGCYTVEDFQVAFPEADSMAMLEVLEALQLCIQCDNDGELEYEFPCYNLVEKIEGLWSYSDNRYTDGSYGGVRLKSPEGTTHLIHCIFPRLQIELRRTVMCYYDWQSDLYQWMGGSKLCFGALESMITFETEAETGDECIEVKVRGPAGSGKNCFLFMEELLGIIDMVLLDIVPGLLMEKHIMSSLDLRTHSSLIYCYPPDILMKASLENKGFDTHVRNPLTEKNETILQLISFGSEEEVQKLVCNAYEINVDMLSTLCTQQICAMMDPPDPHGRDWCLLAVQLGLTNKISQIENTSHSRTASTLHQMACHDENSIGLLINKLDDLGREDAARFLMRYAPLYKVNSEAIQLHVQQLAENSRNL